MIGTRGDPAAPPAKGEAAPALILVIDSDPESAEAIARRLGAPGREILVAPSAAVAERILSEREVSLIILDFLLSDQDGRTLLARIRESPRTGVVPVLVVTSLKEAPSRTECFALGADDCFPKPPDPEALAAAVTSKLQRSAELRRDVRHDPLTGLPNRAAFREDFRQAASLATRARLPLSIAVVDIDHFKDVNGGRGHAAGDEVLRRTAARLRAALRVSDIPARWGGDEFVVLLPNTRHEGAALAMEKVRSALRGESFCGADGSTFKVTLCVGVAEIPPGSDLDSALMLADHALYRAKVSGRDCVCSSTDPASGRKARILLAEDDPLVAMLIKHRLSREGFEVLHYPDGAEAFAAAAEAGASLIILDVKMPGMDGFEMLSRLRSQPGFARTPIMMLTGMGNEHDIVRGFSLGADDYVLKPFSPPELVARIHRLLMRA